MGSLIYGATAIEIPFDDRVLAHLEIVIASKLRRHEGFLFSWSEPHETGGGRGSVWLGSAIPLYFRYSGSRQPAINHAWLEELARAASSSRGLVLVDEPEMPVVPARAPARAPAARRRETSVAS